MANDDLKRRPKRSAFLPMAFLSSLILIPVGIAVAMADNLEILFVLPFVGTVVLLLAFGFLSRKMGWFKNVKVGAPKAYDPNTSEVVRQLENQTEIMKKEYGDRISGYRQGNKKWG